MKPFLLKGRDISVAAAPYIVAEMACAHQGDADKALAMVDIALEAGADGLQLQILKIDALLSPKHPAYGKVKHLEISHKNWERVIQKAQQGGLDVWANVFDSEALQLAIDMGVDALKIHSTDLTNPEMLAAAAKSSLPLSLAVGGSLTDEIVWALDYLYSHQCDNILLMHGYQGYPTLIAENHVRFIATLRAMFGRPVGLQEHSPAKSQEAFMIPLMGFAAGACLIEKHFTYAEGVDDIDHESSLTPSRFREFVPFCRTMAAAMGSAHLQPLSDAQATYRKNMKKYAVSRTALPAGHCLTQDDIVFRRVGVEGFAPNQGHTLIGKKLLLNMEAGDAITPQHFTGEFL